MAFEMALKKGQPMIMSDSDFEHYGAMLTACQKKFDNTRQACSTIIEGCYMSDIHIDLIRHVHGTSMEGGVLDNYVKYAEYPVYNARSGDLYDVTVRITEYKDGTVAVKLIRPSDIDFDRLRAMTKLT